jgi:hypothetical protein
VSPNESSRVLAGPQFLRKVPCSPLQSTTGVASHVRGHWFESSSAHHASCTTAKCAYQKVNLPPRDLNTVQHRHSVVPVGRCRCHRARRPCERRPRGKGIGTVATFTEGPTASVLSWLLGGAWPSHRLWLWSAKTRSERKYHKILGVPAQVWTPVRASINVELHRSNVTGRSLALTAEIQRVRRWTQAV